MGGNPNVALAEITIRGTGKYHGRDKVSKIDKKINASVLT